MTKHDRIELTSNELDHVSGGSGPRAFEIKDFSFGIENPTTILSLIHISEPTRRS